VAGFDRAADFSRDYDGACLQMRMSYSPAAHFFLFLVQWTDCSLAGALGLLRILIYKVCFFFFPLFLRCGMVWYSGVQGLMPCHHWCACTQARILIPGCFPVQVYVDGSTTMSTHERKASVREFYGKCSVTERCDW
jgi:hypothetical protein